MFIVLFLKSIFTFNVSYHLVQEFKFYLINLSLVIYQVIRNRCEDGRRNFKNRVLKGQRALEEIVGIKLESISADPVQTRLFFSLLFERFRFEAAASGAVPFQVES